MVKQDAGTRLISMAADTDGTSVSFDGTAGTRSLTGVSAGALSASSTDAVNGAQLFATNETVASHTTNIAANRTDIATNKIGVVTNATNILNLDTRVAGNERDIGKLQNAIDDGTVGMVKQDAATRSIGIAGDTDGRSVSFAGTDGSRSLTGVSAGALSASSTDAVNGAQLFATHEIVAGHATSIATNTVAIATHGRNITSVGTRVTTNETDIGELKNALGDGTVGIVTQDAITGNIRIGGGKAGSIVTMRGSVGPRVVTGIANGHDDADAVNIAQLKAVGLVSSGGNPMAAMVYDDISLSMATLGGFHGTVIANVANGLVVSGSRQAVNGGQLADIRDQLQGGIDSVSGRVNAIEHDLANDLIRGGARTGIDDPNDAGGNPIINVGDGTAPTDGANVGQLSHLVTEAIETARTYADTRFDLIDKSLSEFRSEVSDRFRQMDRKFDTMGAISAANTQMAINAAGATSRGKIAVGVGFQNNARAMAVGYSQRLGGRTSMSVGGAFSGRQNSVGVGVGVDL